jgi:SpoVK/Ycf46/Vps4 family AAA+-type ATPase
MGGFAAEEALVSAFTTARAAAPALLLIDDIELIGAARGAADGCGSGDTRLLATLLEQLDEPSHGLFVLATTVNPDQLDAALRRPGRLDSEIEVGTYRAVIANSTPAWELCAPGG